MKIWIYNDNIYYDSGLLVVVAETLDAAKILARTKFEKEFPWRIHEMQDTNFTEIDTTIENVYFV